MEFIKIEEARIKYHNIRQHFKMIRICSFKKHIPEKF